MQKASFESIPRLSRTVIRPRIGAFLASLENTSPMAMPTWFNPKLIGASSRLASVDFEPVNAAALRSCVLGARGRLRSALYEQPTATDGISLGILRDHSEDDVPSPPPAWLARLYAPAGVPPSNAFAAEIGILSSTLHLAALHAFLPDKFSRHNWACVYSTDLHGRSLDSLTRLVGGFAPVLVVMQVNIYSILPLRYK